MNINDVIIRLENKEDYREKALKFMEDEVNVGNSY